MKRWVSLLTIAVFGIAFATPVAAGEAGGCSPNISGANKTVSDTSGSTTVAAAASIATTLGTSQSGSGTVTTGAGNATNHGSATGASSANSGDQINGITQSGQCASNGVNVGGQNIGVVNNGQGNKVNNNSGEIYGVLIQNSSDCGIVSLRALAVLRLMTSSSCVGCSTGRSAGFAPFRILST
jgi:hypothetical protein